MSPQGVEVERVEEIEADDPRRRAYLRQIYEAYERTREALVKLRAGAGEGTKAHQITIASLADLVGQLRPMLVETKYWSDVPIGAVEQGEATTEFRMAGGKPVYRTEERDEVRELRGLNSVLTHRDGIKMSVDETPPGRGGNSRGATEVRPLPPDVLEAAMNTVTEFLVEEDLLVAKNGEMDVNAGAV